jgi:hypothetical protein
MAGITRTRVNDLPHPFLRNLRQTAQKTLHHAENPPRLARHE